MIITRESITERINKLRVEQALLQSSHDTLIREHQQRSEQVNLTANQNAQRMQQILGAIAQLTELLNGSEPIQQEGKKQ